MVLSGQVVLPGAGRGPLLRFEQSLSFWGGVDPDTGRITDPRHPGHGMYLKDTVLALAATRGSSSSSAVMLELIRRGIGPSALLLVQVDAILAFGVVVAREMGWPTPPVLRIARATFDALPTGVLDIAADGSIRTPA